MIEIPESITIAKQLNDTVRGREIREVETEHTGHSFAWYHGDPAAYVRQEFRQGVPGNQTEDSGIGEWRASGYFAGSRAAS